MPRPLYSVHPGIAKMQQWVEGVKAKTGRSVDEWVAFIQKEGPPPNDEPARRAWLKDKHHLGTNTAWWLAERAGPNAARQEADTPEGYLKAAAGYVEKQYAGRKAALRPVYDRLLELGLSLGDDVQACPCETIVPLYRKNVFAQIKATTQTRVDLSLALKGVTKPPSIPKRLIDTGGAAKGDRLTHRIEIAGVAGIDDEVKAWLRRAY